MDAETRMRLVDDIITFLKKRGMWDMVIIYAKPDDDPDTLTTRYIGPGYRSSASGDDVAIDPDKDAADYIGCDVYDTIGMTFEGALCHVLAYGADPRTEEAFRKLLEKYGLYYELVDQCNLVCGYL